MNVWTKVGIIGGAGAVGVGIAYGAYRLFNASAQPPAGTGTTTTTGAPPSNVWAIPAPMTGNEIAKNLGVTFPALKAANPLSAYMDKNGTLLLKAGTKVNVPSGGTIPVAISTLSPATGSASAVPAA